MTGTCKFLHTGLTVSDFDRTAGFYARYFGFKKTLDSRFEPAFLEKFRVLYQLERGVSCRFGFLESPDGVVLELFQFARQLPPGTARWDQPGYHHICLQVPDIKALCSQMEQDSVPFYFPPARRGDKTEENYWVFLNDPDGNMIELQQTGSAV